MTRKSRQSRFDPEGTRLPIKLDTTSNGEFAPATPGATQPSPPISWPANGRGRMHDARHWIAAAF